MATQVSIPDPMEVAGFAAQWGFPAWGALFSSNRPSIRPWVFLEKALYFARVTFRLADRGKMKKGGSPAENTRCRMGRRAGNL